MMAILAPGGHPRLYETPADVARAKANVQRAGWAKSYFDEAKLRADRWVAMSDEQLRDLVPPIGSAFAYGFSGCPACGAGWGTWGAGGVASLDKPGVATCPKCKKTFPDADHPDAGQGWHDPKSGKTYYFVGCYNALVAQEITLHALRDLAFAYTITGDTKYSRAAAVLYDRLADLYPTSVTGSIDYPMAGNNGRLERPQYQVARVLVYLADYLDLLYDSPDFAAPSASGIGSVREHIETNVIADGGKYCFDKVTGGHMGLTNGQADYVRGALAAGIMLDKKPWIDCATSGPYGIYNFLDNCLDRDGQYYETSVGYSDHCLSLYADTGGMLYNMRTPEYPNGINIYKHPKLQKALFAAQIDIDVFGHLPRFGDWGPDRTIVTSASRFAPQPYLWSEMLVAHADDDAARDYWAAARKLIADGDEEARRSNKALGDWRYWYTFHADPIAKPKGEASFEPHALLGGRGVAILRSGTVPNGRAALLRYGPSLNHGHLDDLNVNLFGLGRELTYDLGYALGSAHVQVGWAKATASHNLVVVDEKNQMLSPGGGGDAHFYVDRAPVRAVEASSEASYASESVKTYRRTMALVDTGSGSYTVDIFRVEGGAQHDLMWHFTGNLDSVTGAALGPAQTQGSLAGPDIDWGRKVGPAGYLIGEADKGDYWNPPPGNGYGFLYDVRRAASVDAQCAVTWKVGEDDAGIVSLRLLPEPGSELVTARAPGIGPDYPKADYAILRRKGTDLKSAFVSVVEPSDADGAVISAKRLTCKAEGTVGVEIQTSTGTDYVLSSIAPKPVVFGAADGRQISFDGRFGFLRVTDGKVERGALLGGTELAMGSYKLTSPQSARDGKVAQVDYEHARITLDLPIASDCLQGSEQIIYLNREGYSHSSPYRVKLVEGKVVTLDGDLVLARGRIGDVEPSSPDALVNVVPLPRGTVVGGKSSGYFRGKLIRNDRTNETSTIVDVDKDQRTVHVKDPGRFAAGDSFTIFDVQIGDNYWSPVIASK